MKIRSDIENSTCNAADDYLAEDNEFHDFWDEQTNKLQVARQCMACFYVFFGFYMQRMNWEVCG